MKASIITLHTVNNYGSVLQTYATQQIFKYLGYDVEFVDYWRKDNLPAQRAVKLLESSTLKKFKPFWGICGVSRNITVFFVEKIIEWRKSPMWVFLEKYVQLTKKRYSSFDELMETPPVADVYITGSDQVWNSIWNQGIDKAYFLEFAPNNKPRIAFSASIGRERLDEIETLETKELLGKYKAISVREQSAVCLLESMGIESTLILDPTLLLDANAWCKLATPIKRARPYLLVYQLNPNNQMDEYAEHLAKRKKWDVIRIGFGQSDRKKTDNCVILPPVEDFLGFFCNASCVLTDSFHATAFALNLETDFISVLPERFATRITDLLKLTGTENRLLTNFDDFGIADRNIDKARVKKFLQEKRLEGYQWLKKVLGVKK